MAQTEQLQQFADQIKSQVLSPPTPTPAPGATPPPAPGTPAEKGAAADFALEFIKKGGTLPQAHNATAPPDQRVVVYFDANQQIQVMENPNYDVNAPKLTVYGSGDTGYFRLDNNGNAVTVQQPNADAVIEKAVDRQIKEGNRNAAQRNEAQYGFYGTDADRTKWENDMRARGLDEARIKLERDKHNVEARQKDAEEARLDRVAVANIAKTGAEITNLGATTGRTTAETAEIAERTRLLGGKTEADIRESDARAALAKQQAEAAAQKAKQPTVLTAGVEGPNIYTQQPGGEITSTMRAGYVPKTLGEIGARVGQIQAAGKAKAAELQAKINGTSYTVDNFNKDFEAWYGQNVQPEMAGLEAAQTQAATEQARLDAANRREAMATAQSAGTLVKDIYATQRPRLSNPNFGEVLAQAQSGGKPDYSRLTREAPDLQAMADKAIAEQFKNISPIAAAQAGQATPNYGAVNIAGSLDRTQWMPGGAAPPPPPGGPAPAAIAGPPPPPAPPVDPWAAWRERQAQDLALQQRQAQVPFPNYTFGQPPQEEVVEVIEEAPPPAPVYAPAPRPVVRRVVRRPAPPPPIPVNQDPFYQQALAAGLGAGGLGPERYVPPQYQYPGMGSEQVPW